MTNEIRFETKTCDTCHDVADIREGYTTCFRCRKAPPPKTIAEGGAPFCSQSYGAPDVVGRGCDGCRASENSGDLSCTCCCHEGR